MPTQILMLDQRAIVYHLVPTQTLLLNEWALVYYLMPIQTLHLSQWTIVGYASTKVDHIHSNIPLKVAKFICSVKNSLCSP
ncbi:hypothetical protein IRB23SM22_06370 [Alkalibacterium sp. s-m-22]